MSQTKCPGTKKKSSGVQEVPAFGLGAESIQRTDILRKQQKKDSKEQNYYKDFFFSANDIQNQIYNKSGSVGLRKLSEVYPFL